MYVQQPSVSIILGSRLSLIVRVNLVLKHVGLLLLTVTDVPGDNLCGSHLLSQSELYHVT